MSCAFGRKRVPLIEDSSPRYCSADVQLQRRVGLVTTKMQEKDGDVDAMQVSQLCGKEETVAKGIEDVEVDGVPLTRGRGSSLLGDWLREPTVLYHITLMVEYENLAITYLSAVDVEVAVGSGAILRKPACTRKSHTRLVLFTSILTRSRASRRRSFPPLRAYSRTRVSLITRYGLGRMRNCEQSVCSAGVRRCRDGLLARFNG
jgi:hypothetical protein